jgi:hypothetical protein
VKSRLFRRSMQPWQRRVERPNQARFRIHANPRERARFLRIQATGIMKAHVYICGGYGGCYRNTLAEVETLPTAPVQRTERSNESSLPGPIVSCVAKMSSALQETMNLDTTSVKTALVGENPPAKRAKTGIIRDANRVVPCLVSSLLFCSDVTFIESSRNRHCLFKSGRMQLDKLSRNPC